MAAALLMSQDPGCGLDPTLATESFTGHSVGTSEPGSIEDNAFAKFQSLVISGLDLGVGHLE